MKQWAFDGSWQSTLVSIRTTMEGLAKIGPFVRICQLIGFIPFRMEIDPQTKTFRRFTFSMRDPLTWWFIVLKIFALGALCFSLYAILFSSPIDPMPNDEAVKFVSSVCQPIITIASMFIEQFFMIRYSNLGNAIEFIKKADETLESVSNIERRKDSVISRTIVGVLFTLCLVMIRQIYYRFKLHSLIHFM